MITLADRLRKEGIEIGEKIGEKKGKLKTAKTLIKKGINMEIIAEATGFPKKRLEKLAETVHLQDFSLPAHSPDEPEPNSLARRDIPNHKPQITNKFKIAKRNGSKFETKAI